MIAFVCRRGARWQRLGFSFFRVHILNNIMVGCTVLRVVTPLSRSLK